MTNEYEYRTIPGKNYGELWWRLTRHSGLSEAQIIQITSMRGKRKYRAIDELTGSEAMTKALLGDLIMIKTAPKSKKQ